MTAQILGSTSFRDHTLRFIKKEGVVSAKLFNTAGEKVGTRLLGSLSVSVLEYSTLPAGFKSVVDRFLAGSGIDPLTIVVPTEGSSPPKVEECPAAAAAAAESREVVFPLGSQVLQIQTHPPAHQGALAEVVFERILYQNASLSALGDEERTQLRKLTNTKGENLLFASLSLGIPEKYQEALDLFRGTEELSRTDATGRNIVHYAAIYDRAAIIPSLSRLIPINEKDSEGRTPLHWAIHGKNPQTLKALLAVGAAFDAPWIRKEDSAAFSPLHMAIAVGDAECFDLLLAKDREGRFDLTQDVPGIGSLFHAAIEARQPDMIKHLLSKHPTTMRELLQRPNHRGTTPLQLAAFLGVTRAIRLLAEQRDVVDLNYGHRRAGGTALHYAALGEQPEAITLLDYLGAKHEVLDIDDNLPIKVICSTSPLATECRALLTTLPTIAHAAKTAPPNCSVLLPHNLVFQGGGAKGLAYLGAYRQIVELGAHTELRRIAGTSAGAITAAFIAVGCSPDELQVELERDFTAFFDSSTPLEGGLLAAMQDPSMRGVIGTLISNYWQGWSTLSHPIQRARAFQQELTKISGLATGEAIRLWIEGVISKKTEIPHCTFGELHTKASQHPEQFKDLFVYATRIDGDLPQIKRFSHEEAEWRDLIISDAIRASLSIPGVFKPHILQFKAKDAKRTRYPISLLGEYVDGGLVRNFPLTAFDSRSYQADRHLFGEETNPRTLGFSLHTIPLDDEPPVNTLMSRCLRALEGPAQDVIQAVISTYYNAEQILLDETGLYKDRTIIIPVQGVSATDFGLSDTKKRELIESGKISTNNFFLRV